MRLLLASKSAARRAMLDAAGVPFEAVDSAADENDVKASLRRAGTSAVALAQRLAEAKALATSASPRDLVLGADQTLELDDGDMLDTPGSRGDALAQLRRMAGRTHRLHSAAAIAEGGRIVWRHGETVSLTMRPLGEAFLQDYLNREYDAIRWSVGAYRIEGPGVQLFERIEGSHFAILGLPLLPLLAYLRARGLVGS